MIFNPA